MHIQFTHLAAVPGLLACDWCGGVATDAADHARWHYRNESRGVGDASATGPSYGVGESLEIVVGPVAAAPGYGAALTDEQAVAHGLLPDPDAEAAGTLANVRLLDGSYPFAVPVHSVPVTGSYTAAAPHSPVVGDWLRDLREVARARAAVKHGTGATLDHVLEELAAMEPEVEQQFADERDDAAVSDAMRTQGASAAQITREMELRREQRRPE